MHNDDHPYCTHTLRFFSADDVLNEKIFVSAYPKMIHFIREFKLHLFSSANGSYNHVILYNNFKKIGTFL